MAMLPAWLGRLPSRLPRAPIEVVDLPAARVRGLLPARRQPANGAAARAQRGRGRAHGRGAHGRAARGGGRPAGLSSGAVAVVAPGCFCPRPLPDQSGHGSNPVPSEHPNPQQNRLKWVCTYPNMVPLVLTHGQGSSEGITFGKALHKKKGEKR